MKQSLLWSQLTRRSISKSSRNSIQTKHSRAFSASIRRCYAEVVDQNDGRERVVVLGSGWAGEFTTYLSQILGTDMHKDMYLLAISTRRSTESLSSHPERTSSLHPSSQTQQSALSNFETYWNPSGEPIQMSNSYKAGPTTSTSWPKLSMSNLLYSTPRRVML